MAPRIASYRIDARLDPDTHTIRGHQVLRWRNATKESAADLCFHLYLNAFESNRTTLMRERPGLLDSWFRRRPPEWGGIELTSLHIGGSEVTKRLKFVQPDDGNPDDHTVACLSLEHPVRPGKAIEIEADFVSRLPRVLLRSGHADPFYMVGQWYPKIGVFENGAWNCHQYHATSEFYADFGEYDVTLTVPDGFVVGHTGVAVEERDNNDGTRTVRVRAEDVHDFAWAADTRFHTVRREMEGTAVRLLLQPEHVRQARRYLNALRSAMVRYRRWFGAYPYPALTVVDPGPGAWGAAAMEYPMLITAGTTWWMPAGIRVPEMLVIHEFGHQYWHGMVANDEVTDPWLDEGINSYVEGRIMDEAYGAGRGYVDWLGLRMGATARHRFGYLAAPDIDPVAKRAFDFLDRTSYRAASYAKTALVLETLDRRYGRKKVLDALAQYFRRWRFRHPRRADWIDSMRGALGEEAAAFLEHALRSTDVLDYAVTRLQVREIPRPAGLRVKENVSAGDAGGRRYRSEVVVERRGGLQAPVEIVVGLEDGTKTRTEWDGRERWRRVEILSKQRVQYAEVDASGKLPMDVNLANNSRMRVPGTRGVIRLALRWGIWLQRALHLLSAF